MKRSIGIFVAVFATVMAGVFGVMGMATAPVSAATGSSALSIAPKKNYVVTPGQEINDTLRIRNIDKSKPLNLQLQVIDFTYTDDSGTPKLILDKDAPMKPWSLKPYLNVPHSVSIGPGETKTVDISLLMSKKQGAGSYYSAIIYSTGAGQGQGETSNIGLSASGVTLVFASIPGDVNENLVLQDFGAYTSKNQGNNGFVRFTMQKPHQLAYTLKNNGNVTESPVGSITYKYMFGKEQKITNVNPTGSLALIGQARTFVTCIKLHEEEKDSADKKCDNPTLWPGLYTMHLDLYYGQNGNNTREIVGNSYFWYLPWWFLVPFLIIVALLIIALWRLVSKVRRALYGPQTKAKRRK